MKIRKERKGFPRRRLDFWGNASYYMGIINIVKTIKEVHSESIVLVKVGNFY